MDQIKIGKYIAEKRKGLVLTQAELAEKLGMSNKSVSKWERGVCLPDVSVYLDLCEALGISLNEFIAGEDISEGEIISKSEENIIGITTEKEHGDKKAQSKILILTVIVVIISAALIGLLHKAGVFDFNSIKPLPEDSAEAQVANLMREGDSYIYRYNISDKYNRMQIGYSWYENGRLTDEGVLSGYELPPGLSGDVIIAVMDDYADGSIEAAASYGGKMLESTLKDTEYGGFEFPGNEQDFASWRKAYTRTIHQPKSIMPIDWNRNKADTALLVMCFDKNDAGDKSKTKKENVWLKIREYCPELKDVDYAVFFTIKLWYERPFLPAETWTLF